MLNYDLTGIFSDSSCISHKQSTLNQVDLYKWCKWVFFFFFFKFTKKKPEGNVNLFDASSPFIKQFMYVSLGVLAALLLIGTLWDTLVRKKRRVNQKHVLGEDEHFIAAMKWRFQSC